jgi:hypothetical protein
LCREPDILGRQRADFRQKLHIAKLHSGQRSLAKGLLITGSDLVPGMLTNSLPVMRTQNPANGFTSREDAPPSVFERRLFWLLATLVVIYAALAGFRTVSAHDLGWQLATGRWAVQHHRIFSIDVFSYTAAGRPWIYPVVSGLIFYGVFLLGGFVLLNLAWGWRPVWAQLPLLLWRGSGASAAIALLAVPLIANRTVPRAEMFTTLLFATFLVLSWEYHQTGVARLWQLPLLMVAWVNLHLGFIAGWAVLTAYVYLELLEISFPGARRMRALGRLKRATPWVLATVLATLVNPWGWGLFAALLGQQRAMALHSAIIAEWSAVPMSSLAFARSLSLRNGNDAFYLLFAVGVVGIGFAAIQRRAGAAVLLAAALYLGARHSHNEALFACVVVVVAGDVLAIALRSAQRILPDAGMRAILSLAAAALMVVFTGVRCADLVSNRRYLGDTTILSFGGGLSWWFPQGAARFIEDQKPPGRIFNTYDEGGFVM